MARRPESWRAVPRRDIRGHSLWTLYPNRPARPDSVGAQPLESVEPSGSLLDARELARDWTDAGDVERTKPEPDLVAAAVEKAGGGSAVMIGDSTWDCEAAGRAGLETIAVLTGGFSEAELREAGAACVFSSLAELRDELERTPLS